MSDCLWMLSKNLQFFDQTWQLHHLKCWVVNEWVMYILLWQDDTSFPLIKNDTFRVCLVLKKEKGKIGEWMEIVWNDALSTVWHTFVKQWKETFSWIPHKNLSMPNWAERGRIPLFLLIVLKCPPILYIITINISIFFFFLYNSLLFSIHISFKKYLYTFLMRNTHGKSFFGDQF